MHPECCLDIGVHLYWKLQGCFGAVNLRAAIASHVEKNAECDIMFYANDSIVYI